VRISGGCMTPSLADGTTVCVAPARLYWPGDVVAFLSASGRVVAHRVIGYRPTRARLLLWTQADGSATPDAPVPFDRVLGRAETHVAPGDRAAALVRFARHVGRRAAARMS